MLDIAYIRSEGFRRYFANTSWLVAEKVVRIGVAFFVGIWVARYLGPERFGLLSYAISLVALFSAVASLGMDEIVVKELVENPNQRNILLGTSFVVRGMGAVLVLALVYLVLALTSTDHYTKVLVLIIAGGMLFQSASVISFYFQAQVLAKLNAIALFSSLVVSSAFKITLILAGAPLLYFAVAVVIESVVLAFSLIFIYTGLNLGPSKWRFSKPLASQLLRSSWPLMLAGIAIMIYMRIDQVMIKAMLGNEAVGNYAAAVRVSEAWYFIPVAICSSLFPAIIKSKEISEDDYYSKLQKVYDLVVWLAIAIAIPVTVLADIAILVLFGPQYHAASSVLKIHIWAGVFVFLGVASGKWYVVENLQRYSFYRTLAGAVVNVFLNFLLIPRMGITGAALATIVSYFTAAYLSVVFSKHSRKNFWIATKSFNPVAAQRRLFHD